MTTRAEIAQVLYTDLVRFVDSKLAGKEALLAQTPLGGYVEQMRTMSLGMASALAHTGYLSWSVVGPRLVDPMEKLGITLSDEEREYVRETLEGLVTLFCS